MANKKSGKDIYVVGKTLSSGVAAPVTVPAITSRRAAGLAAKPMIIKKNSIWKKLLLFLVGVVIFIVISLLVLIALNARNYSRASQKLFGTSNLLSGLSSSTLNGQSRGRINIMVVGYSADDPGHAGAKLTDSIMILSLSTEGKTSYMLSIPRDLYVPIPDYGRAKINEAYQAGEISAFSETEYGNGGMGLLKKTIYESLGIRAGYFALVNYAAVRDTTDALNGITVNIQSSDPRGIFDPNFLPAEGGPLNLANGSQIIDGQTALRLTRARGAAGNSYGLAQSDFDRTKNQQEVILGIKNEVSIGLLINPFRNEKFLDGVANNITTDIAINEVLPLLRLFNKVPSAELKPLSLREFNKQNLLRSYTTPYGQSALIPAAGINDFSDIQAALSSLD